MKDLVVLLRLAVLVISIISIISYYSTSKKRRKRAIDVRSDMQPKRQLTQEEAEACRVAYPRLKEIEVDAPVYEISGTCSSTELRVRGGATSTIHYLGDFEIAWIPVLSNFMGEDNKAEVIFLSKGQAVIVSLNGEYSIVDELRVKEAFTPSQGDSSQGETSSVKSAGLAEPGETLAVSGTTLTALPTLLSEAVRRYLRFDVRLPAMGALGVAAFLPLFSLSKGALILAVDLAVVGLFLLYWKKFPRSGKHPQLHSLKGSIRALNNQGSMIYSMGRFSLTIPAHWKERLPLGEEVTVTGYLNGQDGRQFTVVMVGERLSLEKEIEAIPPRPYARFTLAAIILAVGLVAQLAVYNPIADTGRLITYEKHKGERVEFSDFDSIRSERFVPGREVSFNNVRVAPSYEVNEWGVSSRFSLIPASTKIEPDFAGAEKRLEALKELQKTEDALGILVLNSQSYMEYISNITMLGPYSNSKTIADFADTFSDSDEFSALSDMVSEFFADENSSDDEIERLYQKYQVFLDAEAQVVSEQIKQAILGATKFGDAIVLTDFDPSTQEVETSLLYGIELEDVEYFERIADRTLGSSGLAFYTGKDRLPAFDKIDKIRSIYSDANNLISLRGIISYAEYPADDFPRLGINTSESYSDATKALPSIEVFYATLAIFLLCAFMTLRGYQYDKKRIDEVLAKVGRS